MARTKTRRTPPPTATIPSDPPPPPLPKSSSQNEEPQEPKQEEESESESSSDLSSLISLLTSSISLSLHFLTSSDLLLLPSQSLSLSSLLHSSSLSLSSLLHHTPNNNNNNNNITITSPPPPPPPISPHKFSWFRRFLTSSTSPSDPRWLENFRMSKPSFYLLLQTLTPSLLSLSTSPLPPDLKLASALFRLAHAAPFPFLARRFFSLSSPPSLACRAFYEVCAALSRSLPHLFELSSDITRVLQGFNWISLPNCCGVLSFCRFPITPPHLLGGSLIAQCLVDSEGRFLDVSVGWLGLMNAHDILTKTKLYTAQSAVLGTNTTTNTPSPRYFIGGSCCPLLPWLLTPYRRDNTSSALGAKEEVFNTVHARGMELAERAIGRLRARWKILKMEWKEECAEALPYVVVATCLLHNYLIKCSEPGVAEEGEEGGVMNAGFEDFEGENDECGERIRDMLALHLSQN